MMEWCYWKLCYLLYKKFFYLFSKFTSLDGQRSLFTIFMLKAGRIKENWQIRLRIALWYSGWRFVSLQTLVVTTLVAITVRSRRFTVSSRRRSSADLLLQIPMHSRSDCSPSAWTSITTPRVPITATISGSGVPSVVVRWCSMYTVNPWRRTFLPMLSHKTTELSRNSHAIVAGAYLQDIVIGFR